MRRARRTDAAELDLRSIALRIAQTAGRPATADKMIVELVEQAERLARLPVTSQLGTAIPEIGDGVRIFPYKRWVILFRYQPHGVDILRFADGSQDYLAWKLG